jgi:class 3 adenylate cyclase
MTDLTAPPNIPPSTEPIGSHLDADTLAPRELRVVLVCDVVESVRWMEQDEDDAVSRWQICFPDLSNLLRQKYAFRLAH